MGSKSKKRDSSNPGLVIQGAVARSNRIRLRIQALSQRDIAQGENAGQNIANPFGLTWLD